MNTGKTPGVAGNLRKRAVVWLAAWCLGWAGASAAEPPEVLRTGEWLQVNGAALRGQVVAIGVRRASPMSNAPAGWRDFYCFTAAGRVHVLVPEDLAPAFLERYGVESTPPQKLAGLVEVAGDGSVYLRVQAPPAVTSKTRTWTSSDGRRIEADFLWATDSEVGIRRASDGRTFTIRINTLSPDDQAWVKARRP